MAQDVMDICTNACERNVANNEKVRNIENNRRTRPAPHVTHQCAQAIKEVLDQRYGPSWHVVVGEGFGFDISYEVKSHCCHENCCPHNCTSVKLVILTPLIFSSLGLKTSLHVLCWQPRCLCVEMFLE